MKKCLTWLTLLVLVACGDGSLPFSSSLDSSPSSSVLSALSSSSSSSSSSSLLSSLSSGEVDFPADDGEGIDYQIVAQVDVDALTLTARQVTWFDVDAVEEIVFHLYANSYRPDQAGSNVGEISKFGGIEVSGVEVNGRGREFSYTADYQNMIIDAGVSGRVEVAFDFVIDIPVSTSRLGLAGGICSITQWNPLLAKVDGQGMWDLNPYSVRGESDYIDDSSYLVEVSYPDDYTIAISGQATTTVDGSRKVTLAHSPHTRNFVFILGDNFQVVEREVAGATIRLHYDLDDAEAIETNLPLLWQTLGDAILFFEERIGDFIHGYDFDVVATNVVGFAMEYSGLVQMGRYFNYSSGYSTLVHELAHQWFYGAVGSSSYDDPLIDEGFTSFITGYFDSTLGEVAMTYRYYTGLYPAASQVGQTMDYYEAPGVNSLVYTIAIYYGMPTILYDLMEAHGSEAIERLLALLYDQYCYQIITRADLYRAVDEVYGATIGAKFVNLVENGYQPNYF